MKTILSNDYFNALYNEDGERTHQESPDELDAETLAVMYPDAAFYVVPQKTYDDVVDGYGYPFHLEMFPLHRCDKIR